MRRALGISLGHPARSRPVELASVARLGVLAAIVVLMIGAVFAAFVVQHKEGWPLVKVRESRITIKMAAASSEVERNYLRDILAQKQFFSLGITSIQFPDNSILQVHTSVAPEAAEWEQSLLSALNEAHALAVGDTQRQYEGYKEEATRIQALLERLSGTGEDQVLAELLDRRLTDLRAAMEPIAARLERWRELNILSIEREDLLASQKVLLLSHAVTTLVAALCVGFLVGYARSLLRRCG